MVNLPDNDRRRDHGSKSCHNLTDALQHIRQLHMRLTDRHHIFVVKITVLKASQIDLTRFVIQHFVHAVIQLHVRNRFDVHIKEQAEQFKQGFQRYNAADIQHHFLKSHPLHCQIKNKADQHTGNQQPVHIHENPIQKFQKNPLFADCPRCIQHEFAG